MKIENKNNKITPFGGLFLIEQAIVRKNISGLIDRFLGARGAGSPAPYSYSDIIISQLYTVLAGGDCAEDVHEHLGPHLRELLHLNVPSADTILRGQQELATATETLYSDQGNANQININDELNELLVKAAITIGLLKPGVDYTLDFDHVFLPTEKFDAQYSYKKEKGYFPAVASIGNIPVYIEGRNGNCNVQFNQLETFKRLFKLLDKFGIKIKRCRMDSGSYLKELTEWLGNRNVNFYIRADRSDRLLFTASQTDEWQPAKINHRQYQVNSFDYAFGDTDERMVTYRMPNKTGQVDLTTGDSNNYLFLITNDQKWAEQKIIRFYNQRGASERLFDTLNNDFGWSKMPHSDLHHNTVYLIIWAICRNLYQWLIILFSQQHPFLKPCFRLKKFTFRFICVAAKLTRSARQWTLNLFTHKKYHLQYPT